jgi:hypothetical protein
MIINAERLPAISNVIVCLWKMLETRIYSIQTSEVSIKIIGD